MGITVRAYSNGDHAAVVWLPDGAAAIDDCRGFAVKRIRGGQESFLHSFVGFAQGDPFPTADPWKWPLQRYLWWDYAVKPGDAVSYQVIPVTGTAAALTLRTELASDPTPEMTISSQFTPHVAAYFNRGVVAAQWVSRDLDAEAAGQARQTALLDLISKPGDKLRDALGAELKAAVLGLLSDLPADGSLYAALYELNDPELLAGLEQIGARANLVLGNGAFKPPEKDENADVRKQLKDHSQVHVSDRIVSSGHFAHNKFLVCCDAAGAAQRVLSGSTNWTMTGLCTQANNGIVIDDAAVAGRFLTQFEHLKAAGNGFPKELIDANSQEQQFTVDGITVTPWFAPTNDEQDLDYARALIAGAKQAALFLFFNPGIHQAEAEKKTLLQNVLERRGDDLYMRGVVNQEIDKLTENPVTLIGPDGATPLGKAVLVPANIKQRFGAWEDELRGASQVMVHSKVIVLDPLGEHPVVMTGSHNLGLKASSKNDDNLVILEGPAAGPLALAYAVNIIAIYEAYRWNAYVTAHAADATAWHGLQDTADWQTGHLQGDALAELKFWTS
jgi:PLD-like domain